MNLTNINNIKSLNINNKVQKQKIQSNNIKSNSISTNNLDTSIYSTPGASKLTFGTALKKTSPISVVSFAGGNPDQVGLISAELKQIDIVGGVATYMDDQNQILFKKNGTVILPYYNGKFEYDPETGKVTKDVEVIMKDGQPIYTNKDLRKIKVEDLKEGDYHKLQEVGSTMMEWAGKEEKVTLYSTMLQFKDKNGELIKKKAYMVYSDATARMPKAYADGTYSSGPNVSKEVYGTPYGKFAKAYAELKPIAQKDGFNPKHYMLEDSQAFLFPQAIGQKILKGDEDFKDFGDVKFGGVGHNTGPGYQGEMSAKDMFYNTANNELVNKVHKDKAYIKAKLAGQEEEYFEKFVNKAKDGKGAISSSKVLMEHAKHGRVVYFNPVADETFNSMITKKTLRHTETAYGLTDDIIELKDQGKAGGIQNGFNDPNFSPRHKVMMGPRSYYNDLRLAGKDDQGNDILVEIKDTVKNAKGQDVTITHKAMKTFDSSMSYKEIMQAKAENAANLLRRCLPGAKLEHAIGLDGKGKGLIGHIDPALFDDNLEKLKSDINLIGSLGRGDTQKGLDSVIMSFVKFVKANPKEAKKTVMILGGDLTTNKEEAAKIKDILKQVLLDKDIKGHLVFMDGFVPNKPLFSACDTSSFASRFEPYGYTDIENMKFGSKSNVTNIEGFKQKNIDPADKNLAEGLKPTSYRTTHAFDMSHEKLVEVSNNLKKADSEYKLSFVEEYNQLLNKKYAENAATEIKDSVFKEEFDTSSEYKKLFRKHADAVIEHELAYNIKRALLDKKKAQKSLGIIERAEKGEAVDPKVLEKAKARLKKEEEMIKAGMDAPMGWDENGIYSPDGKSSKEKYYEFHINKQTDNLHYSILNENPEGAFEGIMDFEKSSSLDTKDLVESVKKQGETVENAMKESASNIADAMKSQSENMMKLFSTKNVLKTAGILSGIATVTGIIINYMKPRNTVSALTPEHTPYKKEIKSTYGQFLKSDFN